MIPIPPSLRLITRAPAPVRAKPLFGHPGWLEAADAAAVLLLAEGDAPLDALAAAAQIPRAGSLAERTLVFVLGTALRRSRGWLRLGPRTVAVSRTARCSALLALGYVDLGAAVDPKTRTDVAWGFSSPCSADPRASAPSLRGPPWTR